MNRRKFLHHSTLALGLAAGPSVISGRAYSQRQNAETMSLPRADFYGRRQIEARLEEQRNEKGFDSGAAVHLMAYKETREMEIWLRQSNGKFGLFDVLPICAFSGKLGPKLAEGDRQTPEGFYHIRPYNLHPNSAYHLALDIGFPNKVDQRKGWTGSLIRIHGSCESIGCYSMGDQGIEILYLLAEQAFKAGSRSVTFAAFPFRPTQERLDLEEGHVWHAFWTNIAGSYNQFMRYRQPPRAFYVGNRYFFLTI